MFEQVNKEGNSVADALAAETILLKLIKFPSLSTCNSKIKLALHSDLSGIPLLENSQMIFRYFHCIVALFCVQDLVVIKNVEFLKKNLVIGIYVRLSPKVAYFFTFSQSLVPYLLLLPYLI